MYDGIRYQMLEETKKRPSWLRGESNLATSSVGVIGAGVMGQQIAQLCIKKQRKVFSIK